MRHNTDNTDYALSAAVRKSGRPAFRVLFITLIAGAVATMIIMDQCTSANSAVEIGQCLATKGAECLLEVLRHFLHYAYRWIFKTCS